MHLLSPFSLNLPLYEHKKRPSYEEDNYFTREAEIINDIVHVYDLDKDWFRIFTLERDIY